MEREQCLVLVEATTAGLIDEIGKEVLSVMDEEELEIKLITTSGKPEAFGAYNECLGQFDLIFTEATVQEFDQERSSVELCKRDFDIKTRNIPTLQFAYQIKEMQPFTNIIVVMDFAQMHQKRLHRFMMMASRIGVETFMDIPNGDPRYLQDLLRAMQQKIVYDKMVVNPIREQVELGGFGSERGGA